MSKKQTILFMTSQMVVGGAERYILHKSEWLIKNGYNVIIISGGGIWQDKINVLGGKHYKVDFINKDPYLLKRSIFLKNIVLLKNIVSTENVTIIEANQFNPAVWAYFLSNMYDIPFLINVLAGRLFYQGKNNYLKFLKYLDNYGLYYNSECSNKLIEERKNISFKNCIEIPIPVTKLKTNSKNNVDSNYILSICRMSPEKMYIKHLIKDFSKIVRDNYYKNLKLVVVGEGQCFENIKTLVEKINKSLANLSSKIELKGIVTGDDLNNLYSDCLFYVGMGTTVIQAAMHRKSIILATGDKKYMRYSTGFFSEDNYNSIGFKFSKMKHDLFYNRMMILINDKNKREILEKNSFQLFSETFETEKIMKQWTSEYRKIINNFELSDDKSIFEENQLFYFLKKMKQKIFFRW